MPTLYNADLKPLRPGVSTHPYDHASKLFVGDTFRLAPKQTFSYYVVIEIDPTQTQLGGGLIAEAFSFVDKFTNLQNGLLVKKVELPKYNIATKTMNAYNRKNIIQTNISYEPITVTFHDDAADLITNFWNDYYTYYYRDSDYNSEAYRTSHRYQARNKLGWGYSPHNGGVSTTNNGQITSFIKTIRIFSLHNKRFTEYRLINPVISSWRHGQHDAYSDSGTMENTMVVEYETVKYFTGFVNPVDVLGFSLLNYDNTPSPISTSITNIYTDAGIIGAVENATRDLAKPDGIGGSGGPLSNLLSAYRLYNNLKNVNINTVLGTTLAQVGTRVLNQTLTSGVSYLFPQIGSLGTQTLNNSVYGVNGAAANPLGTGISIAGAASGILAGAAINTQNTFLNTTTASVNRGLNSLLNPATSSYTTRVYDVANNNGTISVNPQTQQPVTGASTAMVLNEEGMPIASIQVTGTQSGRFNPNNLTENLSWATTTTDQEGREIVVNQYKDGTQVTYDAQTGNQLQLIPGNITNTDNVNTNPPNARTLAQNGFNTAVTGSQFYTNPTTGVVYTVGGTTTARITNTVSGGLGAAAGFYTASAVNQSLTNVFGSSVIGRTVSGAISGSVGTAVGRAVNNGLQPIVNKVTGDIVQGFDSWTQNIKNVIGNWSGLGGFDPSKPLENIVTKQIFDDGSQLFTYKDGTIRSIDDAGRENITPGSNNWGFKSFFNNAPGSNSDTQQSGPGFGTIWTDSSGNPITDGSGNYIYSGGDVQLEPRNITNEDWERLGTADQEALAGLTGPDTDPYVDTNIDNSGGFFGYDWYEE